MANVAKGLTKKFDIATLVPEDMAMVYSNHVAIQTSGNEVVLTFVQVSPPMVSTQEELDQLDKLPGRCIGRIVITKDKARDLLNALRDTLG